MNINLKSLTSGIIIGLTGSVIAFGADAIKPPAIYETEIIVDGRKIEFTNPPLMVESVDGLSTNIYVPLREVLENASYQVNWSDDMIELKTPHPSISQSAQEMLAKNKAEFPNSLASISCGYNTIYSLSADREVNPDYNNFSKLMEDRYNIKPIYLPIGNEIKMEFDYAINNVEIYNFVLNDNGGMKYSIPKPMTEYNLQAYEMADDKTCIMKVASNISTSFSSLSYDYYEGNTTMGYLLRYESQGDKTDTFFIIKTDAHLTLE